MNSGTKRKVRVELGSRTFRAEVVTPRSPALDAQGRELDPAELLDLMRDHMPVDGLVLKKIGYFLRSLPVVDGLNDFLALFRSASELVVEICTATETSISIGNFASIKITDSEKETLIVRKTVIVPRGRL